MTKEKPLHLEGSEPSGGRRDEEENQCSQRMAGPQIVYDLSAVSSRIEAQTILFVQQEASSP